MPSSRSIVGDQPVAKANLELLATKFLNSISISPLGDFILTIFTRILVISWTTLATLEIASFTVKPLPEPKIKCLPLVLLALPGQAKKALTTSSIKI